MDENPSATMWGRISVLIPYAVTAIGVIGLLAAAGFLAMYVFGAQNGSTEAPETLRFIALLIMFMVALAATAAIFVSLRMGNATEAFGLPSGSIRALLALGIMILFVVFGMPVISSEGEPIEPVKFNVPHERLSDTIRSNHEQGFQVQIINPGAAATSTPPAQSQPATVRIIGRLPTQSGAQLELTKQLLTAIITLLTTVIGFYFGSRSTTDGIKEGGDGSGATAATTLAALRKQVEDAFAPLKAEVATVGGTIDRWQADPKTAGNQARLTAIGQAADLRAGIEEKRDAIATALKAAETELAALGAATGNEERTRRETAARNHLQTAGQAVQALRDALAPYREKANAIQ